MASLRPTEISRHSKPMRRLYVDVLNYSHKFFDTRNWNLVTASKNVKMFISAARKSGWTLKIFIDAVIESDESLRKWRSRREKEISNGVKNMPQGTSTLIGDLFCSQGVEVAYSVEADNDDTIAAHASADGADILSQDRDFFRYIGATYKVYKFFYFEYGRLILEEYPHIPRGSQVPSVRPIQVPPQTRMSNPLFASSGGDCLYRRGVPSPLVREFGNPHVTVRPLIKALYFRLGIRDIVVEEFPVWNSSRNEPCWEKRRVRPDNMLEFLLDSPQDALLHFYKPWPPRKPNFVTWRDFDKHLFAVKCVVYEICSHASGDRLSKLMLQF